jgi:hypothetical protein
MIEINNAASTPGVGNKMLKKVSMVLSVVAALGVGFALVSPTAVDAKEKKQNQNNNVVIQKKTVVKKNNVVVKKNNVVVKKKQVYVVGQKYNGNVWLGHKRHRWNGAWYDYGVGPCWINVNGAYFWNLLACPY